VILRVLPEAIQLEDYLGAMPEVGPSPAFAAPVPERLELSNGIAVEVFPQDQIPLVELILVLPVGSAQDPSGKGGLGHLAAQMLVEAGGERDAGEFAAALERLGADLSVAVGRRETTVHLRVLARHLDAALDLMGDVLLRPRLDPADWERVQRAHLATLHVQAENPVAQARLAGDRAVFGADHPYAHPSGGTPETVEPLLMNDVAQWLSDLFRPEGVRIFAAGDLDATALRDSLERVLGSWVGLASGDERRVFKIPKPVRLTDGPRLVFVDRPGATQTVIRFIIPTPAESVPGRYARELVTTILGGTYTSRLNANLRMDKAITYGASATLVNAPPVGYLIAAAQVETQHTALGMQEFMAEFKRLGAGAIDDEELNKARRSQRTSRIEEFATLGSILSAASELASFGRTVESIAPELKAADILETSDLEAAAKTLLDKGRGVLVLVGDKAEIMRQLSEFK
jgi:predicted Zn-dependent peptidase